MFAWIVLPLGIFLFTLPRTLVYMPRFVQRPFYNRWKKRLIQTTSQESVPALMAFPMMVFLELEMDSHFEKGGIRAARKAMVNKIDDLKEAIDKILKKR